MIDNSERKGFASKTKRFNADAVVVSFPHYSCPSIPVQYAVSESLFGMSKTTLHVMYVMTSCYDILNYKVHNYVKSVFSVTIQDQEHTSVMEKWKKVVLHTPKKALEDLHLRYVFCKDKKQHGLFFNL